MTTEASATDRADFVGSCNAFFIYRAAAGRRLHGAPITYENRQREFAAAVLASDRKGSAFSTTVSPRSAAGSEWFPGIWTGGRYVLSYGPDETRTSLWTRSRRARVAMPQRGNVGATPWRTHARPTWSKEASDQAGSLCPRQIRHFERRHPIRPQHSLILGRITHIGAQAIPARPACGLRRRDPHRVEPGSGTVIPNWRRRTIWAQDGDDRISRKPVKPELMSNRIDPRANPERAYHLQQFSAREAQINMTFRKKFLGEA